MRTCSLGLVSMQVLMTPSTRGWLRAGTDAPPWPAVDAKRILGLKWAAAEPAVYGLDTFSIMLWTWG